MKNSKKLIGILGSAAIVLMFGILQSSVHAAPTGVSLMPTASIAIPAFAGVSHVGSSLQAGAAQLASVQSTSGGTNAQSVDWAGMLGRTQVFARIAGQMLLGIYGLSLMAGRRATGATVTKANVIWGATFIGIALTAPELVSWLVQNSTTSTPDFRFVRVGCG